LFDLHGAISKESTRRWKKVLKEGSWVERLKQEKNNILEGCREEVRLNEGIETYSKVQNPLEGFKELIDIMIKNKCNLPTTSTGTEERKRRSQKTT
jgi:hypothetical protein